MHQSRLDVGAETPLLQQMRAPFSEKQSYVEDNAIDMQLNFHIPNWTSYRRDQSGRRFPQSIAHRGYKAQHPENTMEAFKGAVKVGAHAIETDIHLSKDDVVVLSHDADLNRCFGEKTKIIDRDWDYLSQLRTRKAPHEPMPRLRDLLEYVSQPGLEDLWILLDIKLDNDSEKVMRLIAQTIASVPPSSARPWHDRVVLGVWAAKYLPLCQKYSPGFPITHIGFSTCYARQFLDVPGVSFNMLQKVLVGPIGARFIRDVKKANRPLFVWTVNDVNLMKWSVQKQVDGVITDDPKAFKEVCDNWDDNEPAAYLSFWQLTYTVWLYMMIAVFGMPFQKRFPEKVGHYIKKNDLKAKATLKLGA